MKQGSEQPKMKSSPRLAFRVVGISLLPPLVGTTVAIRWAEVTPDFYGVVAQVIATLLVAVVIELFARENRASRPVSAATVVILTGLSWTGLLGCVRALAEGGSRFTLGLAGCGVVAASTLLALGVVGRMVAGEEDPLTSDGVAIAIFLIGLVVPVAVFSL